jgi:hypothetical protein
MQARFVIIGDFTDRVKWASSRTYNLDFKPTKHDHILVEGKEGVVRSVKYEIPFCGVITVELMEL